MFLPEREAIVKALAHLPGDRAGVRISGIGALQPHLADNGLIGRIARDILGPASRPVRAVLFDKTETTNWALGWHQDRNICVQERIATPGFGPWTNKRGLTHVEPPFRIIERMLTLRAHLDPVPEDNAPLLIAPGSHRAGRVPVGTIKRTVAQLGIVSCVADAGDVWVYRTPILHASRAAERPQQRRVLQVDYSADDLPGSLCWLGV